MMEQEFKNILKKIGENPKREGLKKTPARAADAFKFFTSGYNQNLRDVVNGSVFKEKSNNIIYWFKQTSQNSYYVFKKITAAGKDNTTSSRSHK